jgi:hypothetical protein
MDNIVDVWKRLPTWAKVAVPVALAVVVYFIYRGRSSDSSGTLTEDVAGEDTAIGNPATTDNSGSTTTTNTTTTTTPPVAPQKANAKEVALANHWLAQERKNEKAAGLKVTSGEKATTAMTETQVVALYHTNKGGATVAAKQIGKTRSSDGSHITKANTESPKAGSFGHRTIPGPLK